jgi:hypothetical protein
MKHREDTFDEWARLSPEAKAELMQRDWNPPRPVNGEQTRLAIVDAFIQPIRRTPSRDRVHGLFFALGLVHRGRRGRAVDHGAQAVRLLSRRQRSGPWVRAACVSFSTVDQSQASVV